MLLKLKCSVAAAAHPNRRDEADGLKSKIGAAENLSTEAKFSAYCPAIRRVAAAKR